MLNALKVIGKKIEGREGRLFGRRRGRHFLSRPVVRPWHPHNVTVCDSKGVIWVGRDAGWMTPRPATPRIPRTARWPMPSSAPTSSSACPPPACSSRKWSDHGRQADHLRAPTRRRKSCRSWQRKRARTRSSPPAVRTTEPGQQRPLLPFIFRGASTAARRASPRK